MINVCVSTDNKYCQYAGVVIASILCNSKETDSLNFYILDGGISQENKNKLHQLKNIKPCNITFVNVNPSDFDEYKNIPTHAYLSIAAYYRLKLSKLIPNIDRVIYLDCDTVVNTSLAELYNSDLGNNCIGGVIDIRVFNKRKWKGTKYINSGMLLMDLKKIRENNIEQEFFDFTKNHFDRIKTGDQDIINFTLENRITILNDTWNVQVSNFTSRTSFTKSPNIIHYIGQQKPWKFGSTNYFKDKYFSYLALTPWAIPKNEMFKWNTLNKIYSVFMFMCNRPFSLLRPKFWKAVYLTYIK